MKHVFCIAITLISKFALPLLLAIIIFLFPFQSEASGRGIVELQYWVFDESFDHDTHPDDKAFLVGRAGETELQDSFALALKWELPIKSAELTGLYFSLSAGALFIADAEDKRKNDNDPRSTGGHSEIYSRIDPLIGPLVGTDLGWVFSEILQIGVSVDATWLRVDHGWNRNDSYESDDREWKTFLTVGPELRIMQNDLAFILGYGFGDADHASLGVSWNF